MLGSLERNLSDCPHPPKEKTVDVGNVPLNTPGILP